MAKGLNKATVFRVAQIVVGTTGSTNNTNTGNLRTAAITATGRAIPVSDCVTLVLDVLTNTADASPLLNVSLEHSFDGGTTYTIAEAFTRVTTSTDQQTLTFRGTGLGGNEVAARYSTTTGTNAIVAQNLVLSEDQRIAWTYSGTGTKATTFNVYAICQPFGTAS